MDWYFGVLQKYAVFEGRARRTEYWMFTLFHVLICMGLVFIDITMESWGMLSILYILFTFLPSFALTIRRLHDTGRSGWWILSGMIPFIGSLIMFYFTIEAGETGRNLYGPDPKHAGF